MLVNNNQHYCWEGVPFWETARLFFLSVTVNKHKEWKIVEGLELSDYAKKMLEITGAELVSEKAEAMEILH